VSADARSLAVLLSAAVAIAVSGFISGARERSSVRPAPHRASEPGSDAPPAPSYGELAARADARRSLGASRLEELRSARPARTDFVAPASEEERTHAVAERARRRAYEGAPPVVPHAVTQRSVESCLACHGEGLVVEGRTAPKMSHASFLSCTQCHVEQAGGVAYLPAAMMPPPAATLSGFEGRARAGPGRRAGPGAPPEIPHPTLMRGDCMSCHGLLGAPGLRTTHPERQSCTQCHAPSAALDQRTVVDPGGARAP